MSEVKKNTLIVNYLPQTLTDEEFESMFAEIGQIKKCNIVRDRNTGYSFGFGFVEYMNDHDALLAIEMLNGTQLQHKVIKVAYSRQGENVKGANLYVSNLPKSFSVPDVENMFAPYGTIVQCRILTNPETGESRGIGFILFETRDQAESAMNTLNGTIPDGGSSAIKVTFAEDKNKPPPELQQKYLNYSDEALLGELGGHRSLYSQYNEYSIPSLTALTPRIAGMRIPRGFAMMRGRGRGGPIRKRGALAHLRYNPLTPLGVYSASSNVVGAVPSVSGQQHIVYAYNIGSKTSQEELYSLFSLYGTVSKVDVIWDYQKNIGKGYGFITMPNYEEAAHAIECLNGYNFAGKPLQVSFKTPKAS